MTLHPQRQCHGRLRLPASKCEDAAWGIGCATASLSRLSHGVPLSLLARQVVLDSGLQCCLLLLPLFRPLSCLSGMPSRPSAAKHLHTLAERLMNQYFLRHITATELRATTLALCEAAARQQSAAGCNRSYFAEQGASQVLSML